MKTYTIDIDDVKLTDSLTELVYALRFEKFKDQNADLEEDDLHDKFYKEEIAKKFSYGEYVNITIEVDENYNIVGGKLKCIHI